MWRRIPLTVLIALVWWAAVPATPASAHTVSGVGATNYQTHLSSVSPSVPGLTLRVVENGSRLELVNRTGGEAVVLGYQGEPYLRVGPKGAFENRRSPAVYLNRDRRGTTPVPASANAEAAPEWRQVSDGDTIRWHDHRIHWMANVDPPPVRRAPGERHVVIPDWTVTLRADTTVVEAKGQLVWVPGPAPAPWALMALVLFGLGVGLGFPRRGAASAIAVALGGLVAVDIVRAVGIAFTIAGGIGTKLLGVLTGSFYSIVAWIAAAFAVFLLRRGRSDGFFVAAFVGFFVVLVGLSDVTFLSRSQVPFAWSPDLARLTVAVALGLGLGIVVASVVAIRRLPSPTLVGSPGHPTVEPET